MTDEEVLNYFNKWKFVPWSRVEEKYKNYLFERFKDTTIYDNENTTLKECLYRLKNNIEEIPKCPICGKNKKSYIYGYALTCGDINCSAKIQRQTFLKNIHNKYGENINNYAQLENVKEKIKNTCLKKFGTTSPLANKEIWQKTRVHTIEKYGAAYNKEKLNETLLKKYGVKWFTLHKKLKDNAASIKAKEKCFNTRKKNGTINKSKEEDKSYELLKEKFKNVERNYKCERYPFLCDFYIPSIDLYIECNYHWTHGGHPFDQNNLSDQEKFKLWESKNTKFYNNAINTWTIRDVNKRNIAKENNLNYLEFFTILDLENWLNNYEAK